MFADMTQSVARTAGMHPEEARNLVNELLETMTDAVHKYGGRIDRFLGDGALAVFGAPILHEDDPERAGRAGLEIVDRAQELGLGATVGINSGEVYLGHVGSDSHRELTVMGPVVNLAARLQGRAEAGEVLVGESTERRVRNAFSLTRRTLPIKGIDTPVTAFVVERLLDRPEKVRGVTGLRSGLIARQAEVATVEAVVAAGGSRLILLTGDAGIGKSRMMRELRDEMPDRRWLQGRCLELESESAYAPFIDLLKMWLGPDSDLRHRLETLAEDGLMSGEQIAAVAPFLLDLLGFHGRDDERQQVESTDPEKRKALTSSALVETIDAIVSERDTVIGLDDVHWADQASIGVLEALIGADRSHDLIVIASSRPEGENTAATVGSTAAANYADRFTEITLHELTPEDSERMVASLLDLDEDAAQFTRLIVERAQGNPFYIEEILRSLIQHGAIHRSNGRWSVAGGIDDAAVPESIQAVVMSRVDRLDHECRRAAQMASILGRTFDRDLFSMLWSDAVDDTLDRLATSDILRKEDLRNGTEYAFLHALTHDAVYASVLPSRRAALHEQAGDALAAGAAGDRAEQRAHHYDRSRNGVKAVAALLEAGEHALSKYSIEAAMSYFDRALDRLGDLSEEEGSVFESRIHARRGEVFEVTARHEAAETELGLALETLGDDPIEEARIHRLIGVTLRLRGDSAAAAGAYERAEAALDASPGRDTIEFHQAWLDVARERMWNLYFGGGDLAEIKAHNELRRPVAERYGTPGQVSDVLTGELLVDFRALHYQFGRDQIDLARRAVELAEESADLGRIGETRFALGFTLLWADRLADARDEFDALAPLVRRMGDRVLFLRHLAYEAVTLRRLGLVDAARTTAVEALEVAETVGDDYYQGHAHANLCWAAWKAGMPAEARRRAETAIGAWGKSEEGVGSEFAWMIVWPLVAMDLEDDDVAAAIGRLRLLSTPWERAMSDPLGQQVGAAIEGDVEDDATRALIEQALETASGESLL